MSASIRTLVALLLLALATLGLASAATKTNNSPLIDAGSRDLTCAEYKTNNPSTCAALTASAPAVEACTTGPATAAVCSAFREELSCMATDGCMWDLNDEVCIVGASCGCHMEKVACALDHKYKCSWYDPTDSEACCDATVSHCRARTNAGIVTSATALVGFLAAVTAAALVL